jgi:hypothetical protein
LNFSSVFGYFDNEVFSFAPVFIGTVFFNSNNQNPPRINFKLKSCTYCRSCRYKCQVKKKRHENIGDNLKICFLDIAFVYHAPEIMIWTLKFETSIMLDDTLSVITAAVDCPGVSLAVSLSHVTVIGPLALTGFQLVVVRLNDNETPLPVFFT